MIFFPQILLASYFLTSPEPSLPILYPLLARISDLIYLRFSSMTYLTDFLCKGSESGHCVHEGCGWVWGGESLPWPDLVSKGPLLPGSLRPMFNTLKSLRFPNIPIGDALPEM